MNRYLIISEHTEKDCRLAVKHFAEFYAGYIRHFEWGCKDNDHHAYAIIEAESHQEAILSVPPLLRDKAKAIKLTYFYPQKTGEDTLHQKKD